MNSPNRGRDPVSCQIAWTLACLPGRYLVPAMRASLLLPLTLIWTAHAACAQSTPNPILFVTQVGARRLCHPSDSTFANHLASPASVYRGGDLWIRFTVTAACAI